MDTFAEVKVEKNHITKWERSKKLKKLISVLCVSYSKIRHETGGPNVQIPLLSLGVQDRKEKKGKLKLREKRREEK